MSKKAARIGKNTLLVSVGNVIELFSAIVTVAIIARYLSVDEFGMFSLIRSVGLILTPIISFGVARILVREISIDKTKAGEFVTAGLIVNSLIVVPVVGVTVVIAAALNLTSMLNVLALCLALLAAILQAFARTMRAVFIAHERMGYNAAAITLARLLNVFLVLIAIFFNYGYLSLFVCIAVSELVSLLGVSVIVIFHFTVPLQRITVDRLRYLFNESYAIAISDFINRGHVYANVFFIKAFHGVTQVALFQAAQRIVAPTFLMPRSLLIALFPMFSRLAANDDELQRLHQAYRMTMNFVVAVSMAICVSGMSSAPYLIQLLFGEKFSGATGSLEILIWTILPVFANFLLNFLLTSVKKQRVLVVSNGICFLLNIVLGIILSLRYGHVGASWAMLIAFCGRFLVNFYYTSKYIGYVPINNLLLKTSLAGGVLWLMQSLATGPILFAVALIISLLVYIGMLFQLKVFGKVEIQLIRGILKGKRRGAPRRRIKRD